LIEIVDLYALLPSELLGRAGSATPLDAIRGSTTDVRLPGEDLLVLMAGGTTSSVVSARSGDRSHAADADPGSVSVVAMLATWEDDWRETLDLGPAMREATVSGAAAFLLDRLGWAAQFHLAFGEFAEDVRRLRLTLKRVLRTDEPNDRTEVECAQCSGDLIRIYARADACPPGCDHKGDGHDQGGQRDWWKCRNRRCGRRAEAGEFWLLMRQLEHDKRERLEGVA